MRRTRPPDDPPDVLPRPFRGSRAVADGHTTWSRLRGPRFESLAPDVYVEAGHVLDLRHRAVAAAVWGGPNAVVAGWGACALWDLDVAPHDAPVDLVTDGARRAPRRWMSVHRDDLDDEEILVRHDVRVTSPLRTAYDLARRYPLADAVVGADALARASGSTPDDLRQAAAARPGARDVRAVARVADLVDHGAESPPETRMRLIVVLGGLPRPVTQHPVRLPSGKGHRLDLAWPTLKVALEYDGEEHRSITRHGLDIERDDALRALGWIVIRATARQLRDPAALVARVGSALAARSR